MCFWLQTTVLSLLLSSIYPKRNTQNIWEDFINISSVWKRTQENFCDQHPVLGTKMPCSPFPVTRMQWLAESVPALMGNLCRCSQDRVTHISELRVGLGTRRLRHSWCQEGGGGESLSQHELLSLNSWQDTRHFSKGKLIKSWMGEAGKGGSDQRAGDNAMCHLPCSLLFSRILCHYSGLYVCYNIPNMKFTIFAILSIQLSGIKYIHTDVQPSPPSISTTLLSPQH